MGTETDRLGHKAWKKWGPYVSNRQWGTVREDYSATGEAWDYTPHDVARSKAWRWGEEGIGGISDDQQILCFAPTFWNGKDPILKEVFFGLNNSEGNHGEDVKELFYYLDSSPTHSYMKMLYKYPQQAYPYEWLVQENRRRGTQDPEFELIDTGIFDQNAYFDIYIEYAKATEEDILIKITAFNRYTDKAPLTILPTVWFRNRWSWGYHQKDLSITRKDDLRLDISHYSLGQYTLYAENPAGWLFTENETNMHRLYHFGDGKGYYKDAFHDYLVHQQNEAVNRAGKGTKVAGCYHLEIEGGQSATIQMRLSKGGHAHPFADFESLFDQRKKDADDFYETLQGHIPGKDDRNIQRQALAGLLWNKQFYDYNVEKWLRGDPTQPAPPAGRRHGRNQNWTHLNNADIISMPDKWEFPWYASWDLGFHCVSLALVDADFAKQQLLLLTKEWYMHPNGQIPAYEWNFDDTNPPVHAWAAWEVYKMDQQQKGGKGDIPFLETVFQKLLINFTWWVNRKDHRGSNIFSGGFLGLDNIGAFDRNMSLPDGMIIEQADGTSWMAMYALNMMHISLELALYNPVYEDMATKFFEHFLYIAGAIMNIMGSDNTGLWDEEDEFFYDELSAPDGRTTKLKLRSMVGLIPLFAVEVIQDETLTKLPTFAARMQWFLDHKKELATLVSRWTLRGQEDKHLLSLLRGHRMKRILYRMLDESEFLGEYGIRSLSKTYQDHPYVFPDGQGQLTVPYSPGESNTGTFGGNSNWRGPIWLPVNYLIIQSLLRFHDYYSDDFKVEYPTGSENYLTLKEIAAALSQKLIQLFRQDDQGRRACYGGQEKYQNDLNFKDHLLFNEYFHGDNGKGLGASHQTGWTALIANLIQQQ
ncbi:Glycosyl hydrolase family 63 C-terminal domain-containing protein [bacterium A37T11]|nr:Glycosyl hydrolase family 63 C-terminal domain-containing protein [bacterium A37T11]